MLEKSEECASQFLRAQGDLYKCIVFSTPQSKTQMYSIYYHYGNHQRVIFDKLQPLHFWFKNDCKLLQMNFLSTN